MWLPKWKGNSSTSHLHTAFKEKCMEANKCKNSPWRKWSLPYICHKGTIWRSKKNPLALPSLPSANKFVNSVNVIKTANAANVSLIKYPPLFIPYWKSDFEITNVLLKHADSKPVQISMYFTYKIQVCVFTPERMNHPFACQAFNLK